MEASAVLQQQLVLSQHAVNTSVLVSELLLPPQPQRQQQRLGQAEQLRH